MQLRLLLVFMLLFSLVLMICPNPGEAIKFPKLKILEDLKETMSGNGEEQKSDEPESTSSSEPAPPAPSGRIPDGGDMKAFQQLLNEIGAQQPQGKRFDVGVADGFFGKKTRRGIAKALQAYGITANSEPTYEIWEQIKSHSGLAGDTALADDSPYRFEAMDCMRREELGEAEGLIKTMLDFTQSQLPLNMNRYLAGFCLPKDEDVLKKLYVYLIGQGAMHSRLTLVKYDELIVLFDRAGLDLGVRRDAIQRSIEMLDDAFVFTTKIA